MAGQIQKSEMETSGREVTWPLAVALVKPRSADASCNGCGSAAAPDEADNTGAECWVASFFVVSCVFIMGLHAVGFKLW